MTKKALIITYYWPPSGGSGVQRWVYFSKYLKRMGVEPVVLTVDPDYATYPSYDESLLKDVEGIRVVRTKSFEPLQLYSKFVSGNKQDGVPFGDVDTKGKSPVKKAAAFVRGNLVLPDARKYWKRYALSAAKKMVQSEAFDVIISTGPPHSTHLIAKELKKYTTASWMADFRDPWSEVFYNEDLFRTKWAKKIDLNLEKSVINTADAVVCVSAYTADLVKQKAKSPDKVHTIINGYDHEVFDRIQGKKKDAFVMAYIGYMGKHHPYKEFVSSIQHVVKERGNTIPIEIHFSGKIDEAILAAFQAINGVAVVYHGVVSHEQAIQQMKSADLLLLSIPKSSYSKGIITGKLLEYIATGNPIVLAGENEGDAARILAGFNHTMAVDDENKDAFIAFLDEVITKRPTSDNSSKAKPFSREVTAFQLVGVINDLT